MKKVVERQRNKVYYRVLHVPIWIWVFFVLPGHLTFDLYTSGPDSRHGVWLAIVTAVCAWRGLLGRLPGVEPRPYITHYGANQPNLGYRVACYTAAWIDLLVPMALNMIGLVLASFTGTWNMKSIYQWMYYPLAGAIMFATIANLTPRARRTTRNEGAEKAWFYVAIWSVVPAQLAGWAMWRLGKYFDLAQSQLDVSRLAVVVAVFVVMAILGIAGKLPRTARYYLPETEAAAVQAGA